MIPGPYTSNKKKYTHIRPTCFSPKKSHFHSKTKLRPQKTTNKYIFFLTSTAGSYTQDNSRKRVKKTTLKPCVGH